MSEQEQSFNLYFRYQIALEQIKNFLVELASNNELTLANLQELDLSFLRRISPESKDKSIYTNFYYFLVSFLIEDTPINKDIIDFMLEKLFDETSFPQSFFEDLTIEELKTLFCLKIDFTDITSEEELEEVVSFLSSLQSRIVDTPSTDLLLYYCHYVLQVCQAMTYEERLEYKDCFNTFLENCEALLDLRAEMLIADGTHPDEFPPVEDPPVEDPPIENDDIIEDGNANEED